MNTFTALATAPTPCQFIPAIAILRSAGIPCTVGEYMLERYSLYVAPYLFDAACAAIAKATGGAS